MNKMLFILLFYALAAYGQMQERVAIINTLDDLDSISVSELTYLTDKLRETAVKVLPKDRYGVMTTESIVAFLGSQERLVKVCKESSCLAELGRQVSADYVAQGRIGRFGPNLTIKVELYNVRTGNLIGSFAGYSKDIFGLLALIDENASTLFKNISDASSIKKAEPPPPKPDTPPVEPEAPMVKENEEGEYDYTYSQSYTYIQRLIEEGLEKNKLKIQKESFYLSSFNKEVLYGENRKKAALGWAVLNIIYGLGSYIQGNIEWGVTQSFLQLVGAILLENDQRTLGGVTIGSGFAIGLIAPFVYQSKYNKTLKEALNINDNISLSIDPIIVPSSHPKNGTPAVGLGLNVKY